MLQALPAKSRDGLTHVVIDTPKGSRNKIKLDEALGCFRLSRILPAGAVFPCNFGFVPSTRAEDGDALDVLVLMDEPLPTGALVAVRLLGVLQATQREGGRSERNDRLVGVPVTPVNEPSATDLKQVSAQALKDIEHFLVSYNRAHGRTFEVTGRKGAKAAERAVKRGMQLYERKASGSTRVTGDEQHS